MLIIMQTCYLSLDLLFFIPGNVCALLLDTIFGVVLQFYLQVLYIFSKMILKTIHKYDHLESETWPQVFENWAFVKKNFVSHIGCKLSSENDGVYDSAYILFLHVTVTRSTCRIYFCTLMGDISCNQYQ